VAPILDQENIRSAYRLEIDLLPMVLEMRRRGIRSYINMVVTRDTLDARSHADQGDGCDARTHGSGLVCLGRCKR